MAKQHATSIPHFGKSDATPARSELLAAVAAPSQPEPLVEVLLTVAETQRALRAGHSKVSALIKTKRLRSCLIGASRRVFLSSVVALLAEGERAATIAPRGMAGRAALATQRQAAKAAPAIAAPVPASRPAQAELAAAAEAEAKRVALSETRRRAQQAGAAARARKKEAAAEAERLRQAERAGQLERELAALRARGVVPLHQDARQRGSGRDYDGDGPDLAADGASDTAVINLK